MFASVEAETTTMSSQHRRILIINPNTTASMTDALKPLISSLGYGKVFLSVPVDANHCPSKLTLHPLQ